MRYVSRAMSRQFMTVEQGSVPIVLSAPHGGSTPIEGVAVRTKGWIEEDTNAHLLAAAIQERFVALTGERLHLVIGLASRKCVDFNRPESLAYENPLAAEAYRAYHRALSEAVAAARALSSHRAMLVDLHGQSEDKDVVFPGTRDGVTADRETLYAARSGLLAALMAEGLRVEPESVDGQENPNFQGGYTVAAYGRNTEHRIEAVQLEFGLHYRAPVERIEDTAARVAAALVAVSR